MAPKSALRAIISGCEAHRNPAVVAKYSRYFSEGYDAFGLDEKTFNKLFEGWLADGTIPSAKKEAFALCDLLFAHGKYEAASFACRIVKEHRNAATSSDLGRLKEWFDRDIRNWAHTDVISGDLIAAYYRQGLASLATLSPWRNSASRWTRRAVPVSLISAVKQRPAEVASFISFVDPLAHDSERVVQQGIGWFLRECWKKDPSVTEEYLLSIRETAPRLIIQYATEKIPKESRLRFRRSK